MGNRNRGGPIRYSCGRCGGRMHREQHTAILRCRDCGYNPCCTGSEENVIANTIKTRAGEMVAKPTLDFAMPVDVAIKGGYAHLDEEELQDYDD